MYRLTVLCYVWTNATTAFCWCMYIWLCAVERDNVIFALTHHGGHLGYFEGGIVRPNSVTWLDRVIVEFGTALLLHHKNAADLQRLQMYTTSNSCTNCERSTNISALVNDVDEEEEDDVGDVIQLQQATARCPEISITQGCGIGFKKI